MFLGTCKYAVCDEQSIVSGISCLKFTVSMPTCFPPWQRVVKDVFLDLPSSPTSHIFVPFKGNTEKCVDNFPSTDWIEIYILMNVFVFHEFLFSQSYEIFFKKIKIVRFPETWDPRISVKRVILLQNLLNKKFFKCEI